MFKKIAEYFMLCVVLWLPVHGVSQQKPLEQLIIRGKILDSVSHKPAAYTTVSLLDKQHTVLTVAYSNEQGVFTVYAPKTGSLILELSSVGYARTEIVVLPINGKKEIVLQDILLQPASANLAEVTVTGRKKIIEQRPGMLIYNAENDLTNKGGTAADVLRKAPVLNVDAQGNVTMRGSSNLKILINGKYSGQIARNPADALNMMPADIIKSVEVITTPSAKYDAEGAAGVINIITKKGRQDLNGALELAGSNREQVFNPRIALNSNKWSFSLHGHVHRLRIKESTNFQRIELENGIATSQLHQSTSKDNAAPHGSGDLSIVFAPDSITEISLGVHTWLGRWPDNRELETTVQGLDGAITEQYGQRIDARESYFGNDINLGYNRKFKRPGREITLLTQFTPAKSRSPYQTWLSDKSGAAIYQEQNSNKTVNREWTVQADYVHPFSDRGIFTLESGLKMILRNVRNEYAVTASDPLQAGTLQPDPSRSDDFRYKQDVFAMYAMLKANLEKGWYAEAGLRLEKTILDGNFLHASNSFSSRFTNLVPTATFSKKLNDDQTLALSYTQRLTRPYIWDLNPNANASDPKNIVTGNPGLQPETSHQAELSYGLNAGAGFFLNTALFWKRTGNSIIDFTQTDGNGVSTTSKQNLATNKIYGLNFSSSVALTSKWSLNGNINTNYLDYSSTSLKILSEGWAADIDLNTTVKLPKRYLLQVFGQYTGRKITLQGYESFQYYYSVAAKKELAKPKIIITLATVNPFSKYIRQQVELGSSGFRAITDNRFYLRTVKLTANWEFGGMFSQRGAKKISNDDIKGQPKG